MESDQFERVLRELACMPWETEWAEFKHNFVEHEEIGEYISALSNSATLCRQNRAYLVWGIDDNTHDLCGTSFSPKLHRVGNEELENWLARSLSPSIDFRIHEHDIDEKHFVILEVPAARHTPVRFRDFEYIRIGSLKKKLRDYPEKERELWSRFETYVFEEDIADENLDATSVLSRLSTSTYFTLIGQPPTDKANIIGRFVDEGLIQPGATDKFHITNLGAVLFAKDLSSFHNLRRKAVRLIEYAGVNRVVTIREQQGKMGYAAGFVGLIQFLNSWLPSNELIEQALRKVVPVYPEIAVRELVANALIHQDFSVDGSGPMIEVFKDRIEFTNPGSPLIDTLRFLDAPPQSRNDRLASLMRRFNICEERGSGIDKVINAAEVYQLPAPDFRSFDNHTCAVLYAPKEFRHMDKNDRIRACYQHAGLQWVSNTKMTNASLRARFRIREQNSAQASRIIRDTFQKGLIKESDPDSTSKKFKHYVPFWA